MGAADGAIFTRQRVKVSGFDVAYLKGGHDGEMPPVLYLHGMGGAGKWEAYHMALGTVALTYAPLLPGWPEGQLPEGIGSVQDYAALMAEFLDVVGMDKGILVGHSIGGWIALYLAIAHPERVARLILVDAMGLEVPSAPALDLQATDEESFGKAVFGRLGLIATAQAYGFGAEWENVRRGPEFERQWKGRGLLASLLQGPCADPALTPKIQSIAAETLLVWGRLDGIVPLPHGEALRAALPRARLDVIDRCGHLPMVEKPETFHRLLYDFLLGVEEEIPDVVQV
ncbi:MAG: alpha/beta fold hydrolase [Nitrospinae bacterium]|nr:alpha/beta fold hydrolase [Nitrospinota bacterium]